jgi:integral membrane sensor domain MASE1
MKWYVKFPILYIVVVLFLYLFGRNDDVGSALFVSLIFGLIISSAFYAGYSSFTKNLKKKS